MVWLGVEYQFVVFSKPDRPVVPPRLGTKLSQRDLLQDAPGGCGLG